MESEFGLKARKTSAQGRVLGCPQQRQGTGQGAPDEPELTHRQFLSIPCTMVSCLDISSSPLCSSQIFKDFLTPAPLFTGGVLGHPEQQQSSSCPFSCSFAQP